MKCMVTRECTGCTGRHVQQTHGTRITSVLRTRRSTLGSVSATLNPMLGCRLTPLHTNRKVFCSRQFPRLSRPEDMYLVFERPDSFTVLDTDVILDVVLKDD